MKMLSGIALLALAGCCCTPDPLDVPGAVEAIDPAPKKVTKRICLLENGDLGKYWYTWLRSVKKRNAEARQCLAGSRLCRFRAKLRDTVPGLCYSKPAKRNMGGRLLSESAGRRKQRTGKGEKETDRLDHYPMRDPSGSFSCVRRNGDKKPRP